jgi:hypothetical protein
MNRFAWLAIAILAVPALWSGAWVYFSEQVRAGIETSATADGVTAPRLVCGEIDVGGFPFRFDARCIEATIEYGDIAAAVPEIRGSALAYQPNHIRLSAAGPATIADVFTGARNRLEWSGLEASLRLSGDRVERFSLVGDGLTWLDTLTGESLIAASPHGELHLIDMPDQFNPDTGRQALAGYLTLSAVEAPMAEIAAAELSVEAEITGVPPGTYTAPWLQAWQQGGGMLRLVALSASEGENQLDASGEVQLNDAGQVDGQVTIASRGLVERLSPQIPAPLAGALFGSPAEDGTYNQTVNLRGGVILAGLIPAGLIPPLF